MLAAFRRSPYTPPVTEEIHYRATKNPKLISRSFSYYSSRNWSFQSTNILTAKRVIPTADTAALEWEIDERDYHLYSLTPEEIRTVEEDTTK